MIKAAHFVESLKPYNITAQDVWSDIAPDDLLKLDWNESPSELEFYQKELVKIAMDRGVIAWYPDYLALQLTDALSKFAGIDSNKILTFPGSDVGLETLCRAYLNPDDTVIALCPTYENFFVYVHQTGAQLQQMAIEPPFIINEDKIISDLADAGYFKMFYLVSPNNPCGYTISAEFICILAERFPESIFVIDEAYIEFSNVKSSALLVETYPNVVVLRTFSKAFGMAGLRLGYICAPLDIVNNVNKIRNGKNISMIAQKLGLCALENFHYIDAWIQKVIVSRTGFGDWCTENDIVFYPSQGNFILFKVAKPNELCSELKAHGIYVRNRDLVIPGGVRVTLGSGEHLSKLTNALDSMRKFF